MHRPRGRRERTVGAFVHFGADYMEPGLIQLGTEQTIFIGELDGRVTPRAEALRDMLSHVMPAEVTPNLWGFLVGQLVYGAMAFAARCVDASVPEVMDDPLGRRVCYDAASQEAYLVAKSQADTLERIGEFDPNAFAPGEDAARGERADGDGERDARLGVKQHMGIWRDLAVKKRKTEVDMQIAVIVRSARSTASPRPSTPPSLPSSTRSRRAHSAWSGANLQKIATRGGLREGKTRLDQGAEGTKEIRWKDTYGSGRLPCTCFAEIADICRSCNGDRYSFWYVTRNRGEWGFWPHPDRRSCSVGGGRK